MRRVLFLDAAAAYGGAQRSFRTLLLHLCKYELDLHVASPCQTFLDKLNGDAIKREPLATRPWHRTCRGYVQAARDIWNFRSWFRRRVQELQPDLVYANGVQAGLLVATSGVKDVNLLFHHRDFRGPNSALRRVVRRAERTVVLSEFMVQHCREAVGPQLASRLVPVANGFDFAELRQQSKAELNPPLPAAGPAAVLVADMVKWKRHDLFLRAVAATHEMNNPLQAVLAGAPRDTAGEKWLAQLKRLAAALGIADHVDFRGHVDNPLPLMRQAAAVCSVSEAEPFGRTVVEAGVLGCPLVVVRDGGPEEIVQGLMNATVVAPTADAIAEGIAAVKGTSAEPPAEWLARYSAERHAEQIFEIMSEIS